MKVLYVGCYREGTGWGQAAVDYILAMDSVGIDIVPRAIKLNNKQIELPKRILELESRDSSGSDICIQHVLPHMMDYNSRFKKNIALYATETSNFISSNWHRKINCMDEAWVINEQMVKASKDSGVTIPIHIVPHAADFSKFESGYKKLDIPNIHGDFVFYFVGELNKRKNLEAFVRAFHSEFGTNEPVSILIKSNKHGLNGDQCASQIQTVCNTVKAGLKKHPNISNYKEDLIITDFLSEKDMYRLHRTCNCFVMPSYGEAWCIPAFDAMGFGNTPICTNVGGMADFIGSAGKLVEGRWEPVYGMVDTFADLFTSEEDWYSVDINHLRKTMRDVYTLHQESDPEYSKMKQQGLLHAFEYSYENIGNQIKDLLND